jgi:hypothetical protein
VQHFKAWQNTSGCSWQRAASWGWQGTDPASFFKGVKMQQDMATINLPYLYAWAHNRKKNKRIPHSVDDLVSMVSIKYVQCIRQYYQRNPKIKVSTWIWRQMDWEWYRIYHRTIKPKINTVPLADWLKEKLEDPKQHFMDEVVKRAELETLHTCIGRLETKMQGRVRLMLQGKTIQEISNRYNQTKERTKNILARSYKKLAEMMRKD